jgi:hypothetical protein
LNEAMAETIAAAESQPKGKRSGVAGTKPCRLEADPGKAYWKSTGQQ